MVEPFSELQEGVNRIGSVFYQEPKKGKPGGYKFKSYSTGKILDIGDESAAGDLIQAKVNAARNATLQNFEMLDRTGKSIGTITNYSMASNDIVDIGLRNFQHTEFNQMIQNITRVKNVGTVAPNLTTFENLKSINSVTGIFYGMNDLEMKAQEADEEALKRVGFNRVLAEEALSAEEKTVIQSRLPFFNAGAIGGATRTDAYLQSVLDAGLPYGYMDAGSRVAGVARARATAGIGAKLLSESGELAGVTSLADDNLVKTIASLSDISPVYYAIAQGAEHLFEELKIIPVLDGKTKEPKPFIKNSYIRMTAGVNAPGKTSEKITMIADDAMELSIDIGGGRRVKVAQLTDPSLSKEARMLNAFYESHVQGSPEKAIMPETTNLIFSPQGLTQESYNDLANQVIASQFKRYQQITSSDLPFVAKAMGEDFNTMMKVIFGEQSSFREFKELGLEDIFDPAKGYSAAERARLLDEKVAGAGQRYDRYVSTVAGEIQEDGIIYMKIQGEASRDIKLSQNLSGVELNSSINDTLQKGRVSRVIKYIKDKSGSVIGAIFSPQTDAKVVDAAFEAAGVDEAGKTAIITQADQGALSNLTKALAVAGTPATEATATVADSGAALAGQITTNATRSASAGATAGQIVADQAFNRGQAFMKANKNKVYLAGLAVASIAIGRKMARSKNENEVYDSTMSPMPVESGKRPYGIQEALFSQKMASRRKDPLVTAGVVGNLDRSKINHTSMGPDKNNHLFGG
jgi:hypothetical protein